MREPATRLAIFGVSGFVGSAVLKEADARGFLTTAVPAPRLRTAARNVSRLRKEASGWLDQHPEFLNQLRGCDAAINAAGLAAPGSSMTEELVGANALWPAVLAEACSRAGVGRLVQISSAAVHGDAQVLDESAVPSPKSPYGLTKLWGEQVVEDRSDIVGIVYRPTSVHGADRKLTQTLQRLAESRLSSVAGNGTNPTPQVLVENVAAAAIYLATTPTPPTHPVLHPTEGATTASVLRTRRGRAAPALWGRSGAPGGRSRSRSSRRPQ